jgi:hypothetical protein
MQAWFIPFNVQWRYSKKLDEQNKLENKKHKNQAVNTLLHVSLDRYLKMAACISPGASLNKLHRSCLKYRKMSASRKKTAYTNQDYASDRSSK